jgi:hypothetical protein
MALPKQEFILTAKDQTKAAFDSLKASVGSVDGLLAGIGIASLGAGLVSVVKSAADFADEMGKVAQKVGVTTESLSGLKYAADLSDVSFESLQQGLKKISSNAFEAADGNKALAADFKRLGVEVQTSTGALKSSDQILLEIADGFANLKDGSEKTALAVKLLGKSGVDLIPFLNAGAAGIKDLTTEAALFGQIVSKDTARAAEEFNDNLTKIQKATSGLTIELGNRLIPSLSNATTEMVTAIKEGRNLEAVFIALGAAAKTPFNFFLGAVDSTVDTTKRIKELETEIEQLEGTLIKTSGGGLINKVLFGSKDEIQQKITIAKNQLEAFKKFGEQIDANTQRAKATVSSTQAETTGGLNAQAGKTQAQKDAEAAAKSAQAFTDKLKEQAATLGLSKTALLEYDAAQLNLTRTQQLSVQGSIAKIDAYERELAAVKELSDFEKLLQESDNRDLAALEEQSQLEQQLQATRETDFQTFYENLTRLNEDLNVELLASDKKRAQAQIDLENERAIERINALGLEADEVQRLLELQAESYDLQNKKLVQKGTSDFDDLTRVVRGFGDDAAKTFADFATSGKADFGSLVDSMLADLARLSLQKKVLDPIFQGFESFIDGVDFGGFFDNIFANANGNVYRGAGISKYSNSIVSKPTLFPFAKGTGLMGEAGPEAILPLTRVGGKLGVQSTGGGGVTVNIIGAPSQPTVKESRDQNGGITVDVMFEQAEAFMAKRVSSGAGPLAGVMEGRYGLSPSYGAAG